VFRQAGLPFAVEPFAEGVALVSGFLAAVLSSLPIVVGGPIGSLLASVAVVDGVALNPPTEQ